MDLFILPPPHIIFSNIVHSLTGRYAWWFGTALVVLLLFFTRRATLAYLWRSFHLIEDLVIEKEFLHKIDLSIKILLLIILICPALQYIPPPYHAYVEQLGAFFIPLLMLHVVIQTSDLIVFRWYFQKHKGANLPAVFRAISIGFVYVVVILILLQYAFGVNVIPVIATSTVATAVLGLALQDTLKNLFSGLTMSLEKRFHQGDWVSLKIDSSSVMTTGMINEIGWRTIRLRTLDGNFVVVPNAIFTSAYVTNFSHPIPSYARLIEFPVSPQARLDEVGALLCQEAASVEGVCSEPRLEATPISVKLDQVVFRLRFWVNDFAKGDEISGNVIAACMAKLSSIEASATKSSAADAEVLASAFASHFGADSVSGIASAQLSSNSGSRTEKETEQAGKNTEEGNGISHLSNEPKSNDGDSKRGKSSGNTVPQKRKEKTADSHSEEKTKPG